MFKQLLFVSLCVAMIAHMANAIPQDPMQQAMPGGAAPGAGGIRGAFATGVAMAETPFNTAVDGFEAAHKVFMGGAGGRAKRESDDSTTTPAQ